MDSFDFRPVAESNVIAGDNSIGATYDDAMNITSVPPTIVTKQQTGTWYIGAFRR